MIKQLIAFSALSLLVLGGCSDDQGTPPPEPDKSDFVRIDRVIDLENTGNAGDLVVRFMLAETAGLSEIRLFVVADADYTALTTADIEGLSSDRYHAVIVNGTAYEVTPANDLLTIAGVPITNGVAYRLGFAVVQDGAARLDKNNFGFELKNQHYLTGQYVGTWNDNIYTDFGISADLRLVGGRLTGPFYYTANFVACCGGDDDGTIRFELDGTDILDFRYDQRLITFMDGCDGLYTGDGEVIDYVILSINFEGTDCEGPHTGGRIRLEKI